MGKHKDPIALEFMGLLRARGKTYKFIVEEEYPLFEKVFYADMVYKTSQDQMPIISFEVENRPTPYLLKNAVKYFGTPSDEVQKPWHHFIVVLHGKLSPSDKKALDGIVNKHNVHLFEDLLSQKREQERFDEYLEKLARGILAIEERKHIVTDFQLSFSYKIEECVRLFEQGKDIEANDAIDQLIMFFKERIEGWDVPSVRFATKELFDKLYKYSEKEEGFCELYVILKDLFKYAHSQRKQLIGSMIQSLSHILLEAWVSGYEIEKGEKAAKVLLRLGIDFLEEDLAVSEDCLKAIDNLAGDMFEPEILSKEILLGASAYNKAKNDAKFLDFVDDAVDWIRVNDEYSWDDGTKTYLKDSIKYAELEQGKYEINIEAFKKECLLPALEQNIDGTLQEYVQFLGELETEGDADLSFPIEDLAKMILAYEFVRPRIAFELEELVEKENNPYIKKVFKQIIEGNNFLKKIYEGSDMITTFDELIKFLETSSDMGNLGVGMTTYSLVMIDFERKINEEEKEFFEKISQKYGIEEDFEISEQGIQFTIDFLVYSRKNDFNMKRLVEFLKEVNGKLKVKSFSTGISFKLRDVAQT